MEGLAHVHWVLHRPTRVGMTALQFKAVKLEGHSTTYRWYTVHTQERASPTQPAQPAGELETASLIQLTEDFTDTAQTLHEETDYAPLTNWTELNEGTSKNTSSNFELPPLICCEFC